VIVVKKNRASVTAQGIALARAVESAKPAGERICYDPFFDYMYTALLDGTVKRGEVSSMRRYRGLTGEGLMYGIQEGTIATFLEQRGFYKVRNADHEALKKAYFTGANEKRKVAPGYAIVSATVRRPGSQASPAEALIPIYSFDF
jgi:O-methyltransferase involved in polyketide biosynthesis